MSATESIVFFLNILVYAAIFGPALLFLLIFLLHKLSTHLSMKRWEKEEKARAERMRARFKECAAGNPRLTEAFDAIDKGKPYIKEEVYSPKYETLKKFYSDGTVGTKMLDAEEFWGYYNPKREREWGYGPRICNDEALFQEEAEAKRHRRL